MTIRHRRRHTPIDALAMFPFAFGQLFRPAPSVRPAGEGAWEMDLPICIRPSPVRRSVPDRRCRGTGRVHLTCEGISAHESARKHPVVAQVSPRRRRCDHPGPGPAAYASSPVADGARRHHQYGYEYTFSTTTRTDRWWRSTRRPTMTCGRRRRRRPRWAADLRHSVTDFIAIDSNRAGCTLYFRELHRLPIRTGLAHPRPAEVTDPVSGNGYALHRYDPCPPILPPGRPCREALDSIMLA
jgi:hypothetical protein